VQLQESPSVFDCQLILAPVNLPNHWVCVAIDLVNKNFTLYDSLAVEFSSDPVQGRDYVTKLYKVLDALACWLVDEAEDKLGAGGLTDWQEALHWPRRVPGLGGMLAVPQQTGHSDCGVFTLAYASCLTMNKQFNFTQQDMPSLRRRLMHNLVNQCWEGM
jgi:sentrin-specific protease 1